MKFLSPALVQISLIPNQTHALVILCSLSAQFVHGSLNEQPKLDRYYDIMCDVWGVNCFCAELSKVNSVLISVWKLKWEPPVWEWMWRQCPPQSVNDLRTWIEVRVKWEAWARIVNVGRRYSLLEVLMIRASIHTYLRILLFGCKLWIETLQYVAVWTSVLEVCSQLRGVLSLVSSWVCESAGAMWTLEI